MSGHRGCSPANPSPRLVGSQAPRGPHSSSLSLVSGIKVSCGVHGGGEEELGSGAHHAPATASPEALSRRPPLRGFQAVLSQVGCTTKQDTSWLWSRRGFW